MIFSGHWRLPRRRNEKSNDEEDNWDDDDDGKDDDVVSGGNKTTGATSFGDRGGHDEADLTRFGWNRSWRPGLRKAKSAPFEVLQNKSSLQVMNVAVLYVVNVSKQSNRWSVPNALQTSANVLKLIVPPFGFVKSSISILS